MLPALQRLRLGPCRTGMEAVDYDSDSDESMWEVDYVWERDVRQRVEAVRETMPDLAPDLVRMVLTKIDTRDFDAQNVCRTVRRGAPPIAVTARRASTPDPCLTLQHCHLHGQRAHARSERRARQLQRAVQPHQRLPVWAAQAT